MVVVVKGVDLVGVAFGGRPHLIVVLKLLALLDGRVWLLSVTFEPSVAHYFIDHRSYIINLPLIPGSIPHTSIALTHLHRIYTMALTRSPFSFNLFLLMASTAYYMRCTSRHNIPITST